ncbi:hypothetical protein [Raoultella ornithinolytica]|uniref:hypothetical protein n=1 Tax=Raoultella ornithinolytica TaxID=54291 RepID=UPI000903A72E|nr:hypothetical protein [Raoultella ornithinolytica]
MELTQEKNLLTDIAALLGEMVIRCHLRGLTVCDESLRSQLGSFNLDNDPYWDAIRHHALTILNEEWQTTGGMAQDGQETLDTDRT